MWTVYFAAKGVSPLAFSAMRFAQFRAQDRYSEWLSRSGVRICTRHHYLADKKRLDQAIRVTMRVT
jgi:hypothetical protein